MNYPESQKILEEIKKAKKVLINCHYKPDPDGAGSALALSFALRKMGNFEIDLVCPTELSEDMNFLPNIESIKKTDYSKINFSDYDLWLIPDAANWWQITGISDFIPPQIPIINFDHHRTNEINLKDSILERNLSSTAELLYKVFEDWNIPLDKEIATCLLSGIIGDTGAFRYPNVTTKTLEIAKTLMEMGADKNLIVFNTLGSIPFNEMKFWGKVIDKMEIDEENGFVWVAIPEEEYRKFNPPEEAKSAAASNFFSVVKGTKFGVIMVEEKKGFLGVSFRSRGSFDISPIASELGGGGHKEAAGARIAGIEFNKAVEKVLDVCRKYAKKNS